MFGGMTRPHCLLNADARRELPTRRQRASPPRLGSECPVRAVKRFSACDRFSLPDAFCAGVVLPHGRLPHYSRFRLKSQRRNRRKTGGVGTLTAGKAPQKPGSVFKAPPALPPGAFRVSRTCSGAGQGRRAYRHPPHCGSCRPAPRRSVFACGFWQLKRPGSTPRPFLLMLSAHLSVQQETGCLPETHKRSG